MSGCESVAGSHRSDVAIRDEIKWLRGVGISAWRVPPKSHSSARDFQGWSPPLQPPWQELGVQGKPGAQGPGVVGSAYLPRSGISLVSSLTKYVCG